MEVEYPLDRLARRLGFTLQTYDGDQGALLRSPTGLIKLERIDPSAYAEKARNFKVFAASADIAHHGVERVVEGVVEALGLFPWFISWRGDTDPEHRAEIYQSALAETLGPLRQLRDSGPVPG